MTTQTKPETRREREVRVAGVMSEVLAAGGDFRATADGKKLQVSDGLDPELMARVKECKPLILEAITGDPLGDELAWGVRQEFFRKAMAWVEGVVGGPKGKLEGPASEALMHDAAILTVNRKWKDGTFLEYREALLAYARTAIRAHKAGKFEPPKKKGFKAE